jgi:hypothetical protein
MQFTAPSRILHPQIKTMLRSAFVKDDVSFQSGWYNLWLEPVLLPHEYGDPEKKQRPKFISMAELRERITRLPTLSLLFADQLLMINLKIIDDWEGRFLIFPKTVITDAFWLEDCAPFMIRHPVTKQWNVWFHHIQHANTPRAYFVCGKRIAS